MKIKILRDTCCDGKQVKKDDIIEADNKDATLLINIKKAVKHEEKIQLKNKYKKTENK